MKGILLFTSLFLLLPISPPDRLEAESQIGIVSNPLYVDEETALDEPSYSTQDETKLVGASTEEPKKDLSAISFDFGQSKPE